MEMQKKNNTLIKRNKHIIIVIFMHLIITIPLAYILNIWYDESCSLYTTSGNIPDVFQRSIEFEWQPPIYYVLLNIWSNINGSYFFSRLLSIIFSSSAIFISYIFIRKYLVVNKAILFTCLIAFNPFLIYYALEIRMYTLIIFLSGVLIYLMYEIYLYDSNSKMQHITFIILTIVSIHTQYYMGFLIAGIGLSVFIYKGWNKFKLFLIDMIFPVLSLLAVIPYLNSISTQFEFHGGGFEKNVTGVINFFIVRIFIYVFAHDLSIVDFFTKYSFVVLLPILFLISIRKQFKEFIKIISFRKPSTFTIVIVILVFFIIMSLQIGIGILEIRHTAVLFLPLMFMLVSFISMTPNKIFLIWFLLLVILYSSDLFKKFSLPLAKEGDSIRIANYIESREKKDEIIFVPYNIFGMPLKVHYKGRNSIINLYDNISNEENKKKLLREISSKSGYWWDFPYPDPTWQVILEQIKVSKDFIEDYFIVIDKKQFKGMQLWYLSRKN